MADKYDATKEGWPINRSAADQARRAYAVTPSDTQDLPASSLTSSYAKALYVGVTGDVVVVTAGDNSNGGQGTPVMFKSHPVGYMPMQVRRVLSTGTTATNILALCDT